VVQCPHHLHLSPQVRGGAAGSPCSGPSCTGAWPGGGCGCCGSAGCRGGGRLVGSGPLGAMIWCLGPRLHAGAPVGCSKLHKQEQQHGAHAIYSQAQHRTLSGSSLYGWACLLAHMHASLQATAAPQAPAPTRRVLTTLTAYRVSSPVLRQSLTLPKLPRPSVSTTMYCSAGQGGTGQRRAGQGGARQRNFS
jgi:hypothetical protein